MKSWFHSLGLSIQYFSRIPVPFKLNYEEATIKKTIFFLPLVGWLIGIILYYFFQMINIFFPIHLQSVLLVAFSLWLTGALHADGWMDVWDGLGSSKDKEKVLEIMKDSRVGAMGVVGFVVLFAVKTVSLYSLLDSKYLLETLIFTPVIARWGILLATFIFPYARNNGLGMEFKQWLRCPFFLLSTIWLIPFFWLTAYSLLMLVVLLSFVLSAGFYFTKKLDGLTGDVYGWLIEGTEALIWLVFVVVAV